MVNIWSKSKSICTNGKFVHVLLLLLFTMQPLKQMNMGCAEDMLVYGNRLRSAHCREFIILYAEPKLWVLDLTHV